MDGSCDTLGDSKASADGLPLGAGVGLCDSEGSADGPSLGAGDGDRLGVPLGPMDGSCDTLCDSEGSADGLPLGAGVGLCDSEGSSDGPPLGSEVGDRLCVPLGSREGSCDTL